MKTTLCALSNSAVSVELPKENPRGKFTQLTAENKNMAVQHKTDEGFYVSNEILCDRRNITQKTAV